MPSLGLVANIYNEINALPGWLEMACSGLFDSVKILHAGPHGAYSTDGSIELIERWGVPIVYDSINDGFGTVRSRAVRIMDTEWVMILDADERFYRFAPELTCEEDLSVATCGAPYDQGALLREILGMPDIDAVITLRRHWHDFSWTRPTQSWVTIPDFQMRILRNIPEIFYQEYPKMHERIIDTRTGRAPRYFQGNGRHGPFHDHYHCHYKPMEQAQRLHDIAIYDALHSGTPIPSQESFEASRGALA